MFKLLLNVKTMKTLLKNQTLSKQVKHHIKHSKKNLICISSSSSSSASISENDKSHEHDDDGVDHHEKMLIANLTSNIVTKK